MKKRFLAAVLALAMLLMMVPSAFAASDGFDDVPGHWAEDAINRWSGYGVVNGVGDNQFAPNGTLTRAQAAQVFANLLDLEVQADISRYTDVPEGSWYHTAIAQCVAAGILTGTGGATMDPQSPVTREELFVMFARALNIRPQSSSDVTFGDSGEVSGWAQGYINALADRGFVSGVGGGMLAPGEAINRASVMSLLDKTISDYANTSGTTVGNASGVVLVVADNVSVAGDVDTLVVYGGSASVTGSQVAEATVAGENASLSVSGSAVVERVDVAGTEAVLTLTGSVRAGQVTVSGESAQVSLSGQAQAASVAVEETAAGAGLTVGAGSAVTTVDSAAENVTISGSGTVETANVSGNNTTVNTDGTDLTVAQGTTGVTENDKPVSGGTTVETQPEQPVTPPIYIPNYYTVTFVNTDNETTEYTVVEYTTDLSGLAPEVTVEDGQQLKWHNGTGYVELSEVTVTSNLTLTAVVGSNAFTAGNGTKTYPYLISNAEEMYAAGALQDSQNHFELTRNIDMAGTSSRATFGENSFNLAYLYGELDGNGYTITSTSDVDYLVYLTSDVTIYDVNFAVTQPVVLYGSNNTTFDTVTVSGSYDITAYGAEGRNTGMFVMYANPSGKTEDGKGDEVTLNFTNCVADVTMTAAGNSSNYNAVFVGYAYPTHEGTERYTILNFTNCVNEGTLVSGKAAMFLGNNSANQGHVTINAANCENNGEIRSVFMDYTPNQFVATGAHENNVTNGTIGGTGTFPQGPKDDTLALVQNEDGTFNITRAKTKGVSTYVVSVAIYTTMLEDGAVNGTNIFYASETITATEAESYTTMLKNLQFVDQDWVTENSGAARSDLAGNVIYTLNGTSYYYVGDESSTGVSNTLNGEVTSASSRMISVSAYDAEGNLLCSANLSN